MFLSKKLMALYDQVDLYNRYKQISDSHRTEESLEKTDKKIVLQLLEKLGYPAKYVASERFYEIEEPMGQGMSGFFNIDLRYGMVESIFGVDLGIKDAELIGGSIGHTCKMIELEKECETEGYMRLPAFRNYEELEVILTSLFKLYEDLKKGALREYGGTVS